MREQPKTRNSTVRSDGFACAQYWFRNHIFSEITLAFLEGFICFVFGVGILTITSYLLAIGIAVMFGSFDAFFAVFGADFHLFQSRIFVITFSLVLLFSFIGAYRNKFGLEYPETKVGGWTFSTGLFRGMLALAGEILMSGPYFIFIAFDAFAKIVRLHRLDMPEITRILLWLLKHGRKASTAEIAEAFPMINVVRILPQLRDVSGVLWLKDQEGVVILLEDFRKSFLAAMRWSDDFAKSRFETPPDQEQPRAKKTIVNDEVSEWYATLNLPPFAPLHLVKKRYRQLVKIHHPDARVGTKTKATDNSDDLIKRINLAYNNIIRLSTKGVMR